MKKVFNKNGYITLISVLVAGALILLITTTLLITGITFSKNGLALENSNQAKALADACAEEALQQIRDSVAYSGGATLNIGNGSCNYTVLSIGGQSRNIQSVGTVNGYVRKVEINIDKINPQINVTSWQDVDIF